MRSHIPFVFRTISLLAALADMASIARSHLNMLENGRKTVRLDTFVRIAEALDMLPSELMQLVENES